METIADWNRKCQVVVLSFRPKYGVKSDNYIYIYIYE